MTTLIFLLCTVLFIFGVKTVIDGFVDFFGGDLDYFYAYKGEFTGTRPQWQQFILKPTIYCMTCMASFWGTVFYWLILDLSDCRQWIFICIAAAGILEVIAMIKYKYA